MKIKKITIARISKISLIILLTFAISGVSIKKMTLTNEKQPVETYVANENIVEVVEEEIPAPSKLDSFLFNNEETIRFFAKMFHMDYETIVNKIKEINSSDDIIENNIGRIKDNNNIEYNYDSIDRGILEFFLALEDSNPELINDNYYPYTGSSEYVEALIEYFSSLYPNVDRKVMLSIGAAESGYFTSSNMLAKNNVYGGMGSNGLIVYKNIEYGVMKYIKSMSEKYYDKGLNTVESIGYVFCPTVNEQGIKTVSSHWLNLVNKALAEYNHEIRYVSVAQLNDLLNNEA